MTCEISRIDRLKMSLLEVFIDARLGGSGHVEVTDQSHMHRTARGVHSHLKVVLVSDLFEGMPLLARHKMIYSVLTKEFGRGLFALSISALTNQENRRARRVLGSPLCLNVRHEGEIKSEE